RQTRAGAVPDAFTTTSEVGYHTSKHWQVTARHPHEASYEYRRKLIANGTRGRTFDRRDPAALPREGRAGLRARPDAVAARSAAGRAPALCGIEKTLRAPARRAPSPGSDATLRDGSVEVRRARHRRRR